MRTRRRERPATREMGTRMVRLRAKVEPHLEVPGGRIHTERHRGSGFHPQIRKAEPHRRLRVPRQSKLAQAVRSGLAKR